MSQSVNPMIFVNQQNLTEEIAKLQKQTDKFLNLTNELSKNSEPFQNLPKLNHCLTRNARPFLEQLLESDSLNSETKEQLQDFLNSDRLLFVNYGFDEIVAKAAEKDAENRGYGEILLQKDAIILELQQKIECNKEQTKQSQQQLQSSLKTEADLNNLIANLREQINAQIQNAQKQKVQLRQNQDNLENKYIEKLKDAQAGNLQLRNEVAQLKQQDSQLRKQLETRDRELLTSRQVVDKQRLDIEKLNKEYTNTINGCLNQVEQLKQEKETESQQLKDEIQKIREQWQYQIMVNMNGQAMVENLQNQLNTKNESAELIQLSVQAQELTRQLEKYQQLYNQQLQERETSRKEFELKDGQMAELKKLVQCMQLELNQSEIARNRAIQDFNSYKAAQDSTQSDQLAKVKQLMREQTAKFRKIADYYQQNEQGLIYQLNDYQNQVIHQNRLIQELQLALFNLQRGREQNPGTPSMLHQSTVHQIVSPARKIEYQVEQKLLQQLNVIPEAVQQEFDFQEPKLRSSQIVSRSNPRPCGMMPIKVVGVQELEQWPNLQNNQQITQSNCQSGLHLTAQGGYQPFQYTQEVVPLSKTVKFDNQQEETRNSGVVLGVPTQQQSYQNDLLQKSITSTNYQQQQQLEVIPKDQTVEYSKVALQNSHKLIQLLDDQIPADREETTVEERIQQRLGGRPLTSQLHVIQVTNSPKSTKAQRQNDIQLENAMKQADRNPQSQKSEISQNQQHQFDQQLTESLPTWKQDAKPDQQAHEVQHEMQSKASQYQADLQNDNFHVNCPGNENKYQNFESDGNQVQNSAGAPTNTQLQTSENTHFKVHAFKNAYAGQAGKQSSDDVQSLLRSIARVAGTKKQEESFADPTSVAPESFDFNEGEDQHNYRQNEGELQSLVLTNIMEHKQEVVPDYLALTINNKLPVEDEVAQMRAFPQVYQGAQQLIKSQDQVGTDSHDRYSGNVERYPEDVGLPTYLSQTIAKNQHHENFNAKPSHQSFEDDQKPQHGELPAYLAQTITNNHQPMHEESQSKFSSEDDIRKQSSNVRANPSNLSQTISDNQNTSQSIHDGAQPSQDDSARQSLVAPNYLATPNIPITSEPNHQNEPHSQKQIDETRPRFAPDSALGSVSPSLNSAPEVSLTTNQRNQQKINSEMTNDSQRPKEQSHIQYSSQLEQEPTKQRSSPSSALGSQDLSAIAVQNISMDQSNQVSPSFAVLRTPNVPNSQQIAVIPVYKLQSSLSNDYSSSSILPVLDTNASFQQKLPKIVEETSITASYSYDFARRDAKKHSKSNKLLEDLNTQNLDSEILPKNEEIISKMQQYLYADGRSRNSNSISAKMGEQPQLRQFVVPDLPKPKQRSVNEEQNTALEITGNFDD